MLMLDMLIFMFCIFCIYFVVQSFGIGRCLMPVFFPVRPVLFLNINLPKRSYHYKDL
jgi:hypothetical protein